MRVCLVFFLGLLTMLGGVATAQTGGLEADLLACKGLEKNKKRLKCFDGVLLNLEGGPKLSDASGSIESKPDDEFGAIDLAKQRGKKQAGQKVLTAGLIEIARNKRGKYVIILDNGQIWRQLSADTSKLLVPRNTAGLEVAIKRRSLGAHTIRIGNDKRSIRVERIK